MTLQSMGTSATRGAEGRRIRELAPWFHNLHLPSGVQTAPDHPLGDFPSFKWKQIRDSIPSDLSGWTCLDIGCNAGFYSFELAKRGATVTAIDHDEHYLAQARWAAEQYELADRVRFEHMGVYDLARMKGTFDLVLFLGVLYHLRYPMLGLDLVASKVGRRLVLQTLTMPGDGAIDAPSDLDIDDRDELLRPGWPKMAFLEHRLANDPTNWWAPSAACVEAMARSAGLRVTERPAHEFWVCERETPFAHDEELRRATGRTTD